MSVEEERLPAILRNRILDETVYNKDAVGALFQLKSTTKSFGDSEGTWTALTTPESEALASGATQEKIDSIEDKATIASLDAHTSDKVIHITGAERSKWNAKQDALDRSISLTGKVTGSQTDTGGDVAIATSVHLDKTDVGLDNVDNTADLDKPISNDTQSALDTKEDKANKGVSDGYTPLDPNAKVPLEHLPDVVMGNLVFGGVFVAAQSPYVDVNLSTNGMTILAKTKPVTNPASLVNTASSTEEDCFGYNQVEGFYFIADGNAEFSGMSFEPGDWLIAAEDGWHKIDNTDAVVGVKGDAEANYRIGSVNITPADVGAIPLTALSDDNPTDIVNADTSADSGSSMDVSRSDHVHGFTAITPDDLNATLEEGSGTDVSTPEITVATAVSTLLQTIWNRIHALALAVAAKFTLPPGGDTSQYIRGDGTLATLIGDTADTAMAGNTPINDAGLDFRVNSDDSQMNFTANSDVSRSIRLNAGNNITLTPSGDSTDRVVTVDSSGSVYKVSSGAGMDFADILTEGLVSMRIPVTVTGESTNTPGNQSAGHTHAVSGLTVPVGGTGASSFTPNSAIVSGTTATAALSARAIASTIGDSTTSPSFATEGAVREALNQLSTGPFVTGTFTNANTPSTTGVYNSSGTPTNTPFSSNVAQTLMVFANGNAVTQFWSSAGTNAAETGTWTRSRNGASWPTAAPYGWLRVGQFAGGMRITGVYVFTRGQTSAGTATFDLPAGSTASTCILISAGKTHQNGDTYYYDMINQISMSPTQIVAQNVQNSQIKIAVMVVANN